ncbi:hypothetical protein EVAR_28006_1 [Eumeta japonica]|uniref:Uncharacterized protein n=1 Tax=Eumeta variegata TaxID=151549 RepID=A0A4C1WCJ4_EUMVA|nr:hypothetical protein EVAR_28006_1 [Eumeta japonica]
MRVSLDFPKISSSDPDLLTVGPPLEYIFPNEGSVPKGCQRDPVIKPPLPLYLSVSGLYLMTRNSSKTEESSAPGRAVVVKLLRASNIAEIPDLTYVYAQPMVGGRSNISMDGA